MKRRSVILAVLAVYSLPALSDTIGCVTTEWTLVGVNHKV